MSADTLDRARPQLFANDLAITGIGIFSSLHHTAGGTLRAMEAGESNADVLKPKRAYERWPSVIGCDIPSSYNPRDHFKRMELVQYHISVQMMDLTVREAIKDSGLQVVNGELEPDRKKGIVIGTVAGGFINVSNEYRKVKQHGAEERSNRFSIIRTLSGRTLTVPGMNNRVQGPYIGVFGECGTGSLPFKIGQDLMKVDHSGRGIIQPGDPGSIDADLVILGSTEAAIHPFTSASFGLLGKEGALSTRNHDPKRASRPFDAGADGFLPGIAAAAFIGEPLHKALERGADIYAVYLGGALMGDGNPRKPTEPDTNRMTQTMDLALKRAGITPAMLGRIDAHATSTPIGDKAESTSIKKLYTDNDLDYSQVDVGSEKGFLGHCLGSAAGIETALALIALRKGFVIANLNLTDPIMDLNYTQPIEVNGKISYFVPKEYDYMMKTSFGFGGIDTANVFMRWTPALTEEYKDRFNTLTA